MKENQTERMERPNFVRLSPEESEVLFKIADGLWKYTQRRFVGDTNGVVLVLMDIVRNFDDMPEEQKKILAPIRDKIAQTYPDWLNSKEWIEWRFIPVDRNIKNPSEFVENNVIETAGKNPADPGEGTFAAGYYAEDYAHMNPRGRAFVLAAYNMENMRPATGEESRGAGRNHRYVPISGTLHDSFRGAILIERDSQIPDTIAVRERINSQKEQWIQEAMETYRAEVARIAEAGVDYFADEGELGKMLLQSVDAFIEHYADYVLRGDFNQLSSEDLLKRLPEHGMFSYLIANQLPYSLQAKPGTNMELFTEVVTLPRKLSSELLSKCEAAMRQLFQDYNPDRKI